MLWAQQAEAGAQPTFWLIGAAAVGVVVVLLLLKALLGGKKAPKDMQGGLREDLGEYPLAPPNPGPRRLTVNGLPVRVRLVVVAPTGKAADDVTPAQAAELLDDIVRGLPAVVKADKPRIKVWPAQLSVAGFAPTFHRLVKSPDAAGQKSHWVLAAGPAKAGGRPILVGFALYADSPTKLGQMRLEGTDWPEVMRVEKA